MRTTAILGALAAITIAGSAAAETPAACVRPTVPAVVDGATATMEQLVAVKNALSAFMTMSDTYQSCLLDDLASRKATAKAAKTKLSPSEQKEVDAAIETNQSDKEKAGADFNNAVKAYKAAHPA